MTQAFDEIFTSLVIQALSLRAQLYPTASLTGRLSILTASEDPRAELAVRLHQRELEARRSAWALYVEAMSDADALDDDVRARLAGTDDSGFRSALAECAACFVLSKRLRLAVFGRPAGRRNKVLDFGVRHSAGDLTIEVKSPSFERPEDRIRTENRARRLRGPLGAANKQFAEGQPNILVLVPWAPLPRCLDRKAYVRALLGTEQIAISYNRSTGRAIEQPRIVVNANGEFLKYRPKPRFTRIGAVLALDERVIGEGRFEETFTPKVQLDWFVIHNPHAACKIPTDIWGECPQLMRTGDMLSWTDGWNADGSPRTSACHLVLRPDAQPRVFRRDDFKLRPVSAALPGSS